MCLRKLEKLDKESRGKGYNSSTGKNRSSVKTPDMNMAHGIT
jgi:hypothetical protein